YMVVGHDAEEVEKTFARPGVRFIRQRRQLGTGHALLAARDELARCRSRLLLVLVGDAPLLTAKTLRDFVRTPARCKVQAAVLTARLPNPTGYGRIIPVERAELEGSSRDCDLVAAIREEKACTAAEREIREVSSGILCFERAALLRHLGKLSPK